MGHRWYWARRSQHPPSLALEKKLDTLPCPGVVYIHDIVVKSVTPETGEMAQQLRVLDTFPEDEGLIPSTCVVAHNHL